MPSLAGRRMGQVSSRPPVRVSHYNSTLDEASPDRSWIRTQQVADRRQGLPAVVSLYSLIDLPVGEAALPRRTVAPDDGGNRPPFHVIQPCQLALQRPSPVSLDQLPLRLFGQADLSLFGLLRPHERYSTHAHGLLASQDACERAAEVRQLCC